MTEDDDAFIRTIVDNPGHDLPRLVYADWLDDRGDPRGPFLRAEVEWAQPWKDGTPPGWSKRKPGRAVPEWSWDVWPGLVPMQFAAMELDPLWVARISRPPLGVCCDHIKMKKPHYPLTLDDIRRTEKRLQVRFHTDHVAFLLNHNGGDPWPRKVVLRTGSGEEGWAYDDMPITEFPFLTCPSEVPARPGLSLDAMLDELRYMDTLADEPSEVVVADQYLPVASWSHAGYFLMPNGLDRPSAVWSVWTENSMEVTQVAPSLPQLLGRVIVE